MLNENVIWQPFKEPLRTTLARTGAIALLVGGALAWRSGGLARWPIAALLVLWVSFGGHLVELFFLNGLRPRLPRARAVHLAVRIAVWFIGGIVLAIGMMLTAQMLSAFQPALLPPWWLSGLVFIGIELAVHLVLGFRGLPNIYNGRG
jgi:hypothetical protein